MSDNWNLLAKLLGTPGPPAPPKASETTKKAESKAEGEHERQSTSDTSGFSDQESNEPASRDMPPVAEAVVDVPDESDVVDKDPSGEDVLQALTAETASTQLPGFGVRAKDPRIDELAAGGPPAKEEPVVEELLHVEATVSESDKLFADSTPPESSATDQAPEQELEPEPEPDSGAWSELAGELGIEATDEPPPHRAPMPIKPARKESASSKSKKSPRSFGDGLGIDLGPEPEVIDEPSDVEDEPHVAPASTRTFDHDPAPTAKPDSSSGKPVDPPDPLSFRSFSDLEDDLDDSEPEPAEAVAAPTKVSPRQDRSPAREERPRRGRGFDDRDESDDDDRPSPASEPRGRGERSDRDSSEPGRERQEDDESPRRRSGRRGRRGQRQRMSEDALESEPKTVDAVASRDDDDISSDDGDDSRRNAPKRRGRGGQSRRRTISRDEFDPADGEEFELVDEGFGMGVELDADDSEDSDDDTDEESGTRRRRRGRRGRGGRRSRAAGASESEEARPQSRGRDDSDRDDADLDDDLDDEPIPSSAFDDDHEDDEEVDVIRRGRRRRGRRGGRGRSTRESEPTDQDDRPAADDLDEEDVRPRRGARSRQDEPESESRGDTPTRRKVVPTWQEVVNVLVDNNLENHKKSPSSKGRGRGRRR
ncbi:hypothetical protein NZK35_01525 [Stieleria sp. ICT_E10.1]|uniref:hypothetical protein n=1 Tax=Stieleria sedimenti TaxID=2976331 RepID=UPI00217F844E|nr:hypothetical protein [Stieleria sedimenti]MCS7465346.1 hypothetical protein [Stieleria sedimenti]